MIYLKLIIVKYGYFLKFLIFPIKLLTIRSLKHCSKTCYDGLPIRISLLNFHSLQTQMIANFQIKLQTDYLSMWTIIHFTIFHHTFQVQKFVILYFPLTFNSSFYFYLFCSNTPFKNIKFILNKTSIKKL